MYSKIQLPLLLASLSAYKCLAATDCFTQVDDSYTKPSTSTHRISVGVDCSEPSSNATCQNLQGGGYGTEDATLNITTTEKTKIYDAITESIGEQFNETVTGRIGQGVSYHLNGTDEKGYLGWTGTLNCYAGTLGDCIGGDVENGTAVEACTPNLFEGGVIQPGDYPELIGTVAFVATDDVSNMTTNPSATKPETSKPTSSGKPNAAIRTMVGSGSMSAVVVGAALWCLI